MLHSLLFSLRDLTGANVIPTRSRRDERAWYGKLTEKSGDTTGRGPTTPMFVCYSPRCKDTYDETTSMCVKMIYRKFNTNEASSRSFESGGLQIGRRAFQVITARGRDRILRAISAAVRRRTLLRAWLREGCITGSCTGLAPHGGWGGGEGTCTVPYQRSYHTNHTTLRYLLQLSAAND
eukprot:COSAG02_NODE_5018_length_4721_cov_6.541108_4_plen_179_part_00